ncbi:CobQ/CobB/MinD/ParA nucleotide binding domain protein [mine drainage metagenome]|uniref:CobQ/CobB/MinD/ParA nucleotide binding domain protein n=1 Tax=mine drainage metagenome TaxID=410659 RepID=A0A1J5QGB7_9ZZZZ
MPVIVVANPKGGVGKSTLSTQVAGYLAGQGHEVMLGDSDRQESARLWLSLRPPELPRIQTWEISHDYIAKPPRGTTHAVIDTPAGLHGWRLSDVMKQADKVLVPLSASIFDIYATRDFLEKLLETRQKHGFDIGLVGVRIDPRTHAAEQLQAFVTQNGLPMLSNLRQTTLYAHMAAHGLTLWDVSPSKVEKDLEQWQPIVDWLQVPAGPADKK